MKFLIVDLYNGDVKWTDSIEKADPISYSVDFFVINIEDKEWLVGGNKVEIKELK